MEGRGSVESGGKNEGPTTTKGKRRKWIGGREGEGREEEGFAKLLQEARTEQTK